MGTTLVTRRFTVQDFHRMAQTGIFTEDDRVELLDGEIIQMTPIGSHHAACVARLDRVLNIGVGTTAIVWIQNPLRLDDRSEPQPDVVVLRPRPDFYAQGHPGPEDVLLLIEVADTSVETDRMAKLPLYAKAGIPEVWIVDIGGGAVEVYRQPTLQGYQTVQRAMGADHLTPAALPNLSIAVREILP